MSPSYNKPTPGGKKPPVTGGPMPKMKPPYVRDPKPGGTPGGTSKPQVPGVVQAMKEKMAMKAKRGK